MADEIRAARDAIDNARRKVMDLYGGNLDHPALDHLEAALCAVDGVERVYDEHVAPENRGPWRDRLAALSGSTQEASDGR